MRDITELEKAEAQAMTDAFAKTLTKKKTDEADGANFNFDDFNKQAKAETALFTIKRLVARHSVKDSVKKYILQRQSVIAANKKKKEEAEKLRQNGWQST
jgi:broad specificity polyphosphatase/5'/3'-nucleotidase SurE